MPVKLSVSNNQLLINDQPIKSSQFSDYEVDVLKAYVQNQNWIYSRISQINDLMTMRHYLFEANQLKISFNNFPSNDPNNIFFRQYHPIGFIELSIFSSDFFVEYVMYIKFHEQPFQFNVANIFKKLDSSNNPTSTEIIVENNLLNDTIVKVYASPQNYLDCFMCVKVSYSVAFDSVGFYEVYNQNRII